MHLTKQFFEQRGNMVGGKGRWATMEQSPQQGQIHINREGRGRQGKQSHACGLPARRDGDRLEAQEGTPAGHLCISWQELRARLALLQVYGIRAAPRHDAEPGRVDLGHRHLDCGWPSHLICARGSEGTSIHTPRSTDIVMRCGYTVIMANGELKESKTALAIRKVTAKSLSAKAIEMRRRRNHIGVSYRDQHCGAKRVHIPDRSSMKRSDRRDRQAIMHSNAFGWRSAFGRRSHCPKIAISLLGFLAEGRSGGAEGPR